MGFILIQAGHADGALLAFEKALAVAPNLPMALWGKGMTLYQGKQDYVGAKEAFEKLLQIIPAGAERIEVEKILAEMPQGAAKTTSTARDGNPADFNESADRRKNLYRSKTQSATWMAKLLSLSLLDLPTLPRALPWPSRRSIGRFFRSPTHSVPKTS